MGPQTGEVPQVQDLLREAEALEARAATERVAFLTRLFGDENQTGQRLLDVGCGNGYAVREWIGQGLDAVGVDISLNRLSRWVSEHPLSHRPFVIADATAQPFRDGVFDRVVSSGMIEHIGVDESSTPYTVVAQQEQEEKRQLVVKSLDRQGVHLRVFDAIRVDRRSRRRRRCGRGFSIAQGLRRPPESRVRGQAG